MTRKDIYLRAFDSLLNGKLSKDELWEVLDEHFQMLDDDKKKTQLNLNDYRNKYEHLLKAVNEAYEAHKKYFNQF